MEKCAKTRIALFAMRGKPMSSSTHTSRGSRGWLRGGNGGLSRHVSGASDWAGRWQGHAGVGMPVSPRPPDFRDASPKNTN